MRTEADARGGLGSKVFAERLAVLRCGCDHPLWWCGSEGAKSCEAALGAVPSIELVQVGDNDEPVPVLPFDLARAHELHKALLGTRHRPSSQHEPPVGTANPPCNTLVGAGKTLPVICGTGRVGGLITVDDGVVRIAFGVTYPP